MHVRTYLLMALLKGVDKGGRRLSMVGQGGLRRIKININIHVCIMFKGYPDNIRTGGPPFLVKRA